MPILPDFHLPKQNWAIVSVFSYRFHIGVELAAGRLDAEVVPLLLIHARRVILPTRHVPTGAHVARLVEFRHYSDALKMRGNEPVSTFSANFAQVDTGGLQRNFAD